MNANELIAEIEGRTNRHVDQQISDDGYRVWLGEYTDEHVRRETQDLVTVNERDERRLELRNEPSPLDESEASAADTLEAALQELLARIG